MIELINVSKYYLTGFGRHYVFRDVNLVLPLDKSVAVIGPNGAGKSTFLRLLGGADQPSSGTIIKTGRISPPMGLTPGLQPSLNGVENARFAGRIYGMEREEINEMIDYVRNLANIGRYFDMPVSTYSAGMRQRVSFAINMSMQFDYYLFDEIGAGGDREFRKVAKQMVKDRLASSKFIMTSHNTGELLEICDSGIVIQNGEFRFFEDIRDAVDFYGENPDEELRSVREELGESAAEPVPQRKPKPVPAAPAYPPPLPPPKDKEARRAAKLARSHLRRLEIEAERARKIAEREAIREKRAEQQAALKAERLAAHDAKLARQEAERAQHLAQAAARKAARQPAGGPRQRDPSALSAPKEAPLLRQAPPALPRTQAADDPAVSEARRAAADVSELPRTLPALTAAAPAVGEARWAARAPQRQNGSAAPPAPDPAADEDTGRRTDLRKRAER